jgi:hypothetical protein
MKESKQRRLSRDSKRAMWQQRLLRIADRNIAGWVKHDWASGWAQMWNWLGGCVMRDSRQDQREWIPDLIEDYLDDLEVRNGLRRTAQLRESQNEASK